MNLQSLIIEIASYLNVDEREVRLKLINSKEYVAHTTINWIPDTPEITISANCLNNGVLAHEITHALMPTKAIFFGEGFANMMHAYTDKNCNFLFFSEKTLDEVVVKYYQRDFPFELLLDENYDNAKMFAIEKFYLMDNRLGYAVAGSFCNFLLLNYPLICREIVKRRNFIPSNFLEQFTNLKVKDLKQQWSDTIKCIKVF